jgi:hypothetical protein
LKRARLVAAAAQLLHALRHAFAMRLLHRGVGLKIGDPLGSQSGNPSTRIDTDMLRAVALPMPMARATQEVDMTPFPPPPWINRSLPSPPRPGARLHDEERILSSVRRFLAQASAKDLTTCC